MASPSMSTESESSAVEWASKLATNSPTNIAALTHSTISRTRRWRVANSVPISQQSFMRPSVPHARVTARTRLKHARVAGHPQPTGDDHGNNRARGRTRIARTDHRDHGRVARGL